MPSCGICKGVCCCGAQGICEAIQNVKIGRNEHGNGIDKNSECFKHLQEHLRHDFHWSVLSVAHRNTFKLKF